MNWRRFLALAAAMAAGVFIFAGNASASLPAVSNCIQTEGTTTIVPSNVAGKRLVTGTFTVTCPTTVSLVVYAKTGVGLTFPQVIIASTSASYTQNGTYTLTLTVPACGAQQYDLFENLTAAQLPDPLLQSTLNSTYQQYVRRGVLDDTSMPACPGTPRTIGYWKNWASCASSSGGQTFVTDQVLAQGPIVFGTLVIDTCQEAVAILNKSSLDNTKRASDPAYNLAAQLLAAELNIRSGATTCANVTNAIANSLSLLQAVGFNGTTATTMTSAQATQANTLATFLDNYNNGIAVC
jgi:hypothetical protein